FHINENVYQFIEGNGDIKVFGAPIQQPKSVGQDVWRQCFEYICLEYVGNGKDIRVLPLGNEYYSQTQRETDENTVHIPIIVVGPNGNNIQPTPVIVTPVGEQDESPQVPTVTPAYLIDIHTEVRQELITSTEEQLIMITMSLDGKPLEGINTQVVIHYPGGEVDKFYPSITDRDGKTSLSLKPISAPNGTRIEY
ncbi:MAG: hypothetical protein GWN00_27410, partial [Aliifodinibius sp.]|nr:hypothetical protein [candidate division Zixibacteria bacterium]NIT59812.1 hypothetical protein [Fodinibius sp.]NIS47755.1 hypothetical protein [candidate division Zixibacteria bacterium]NIU15861.1 hypothetical protein [candidate division Zixibacteria bacterium]NIV14549.1 hypothetical protein [Fodinibius sp.]